MRDGRIQDYKALIGFMRPLVKLHETIQPAWEPELSSEEFATKLLENYVNGGYYYGELDGDENILYFLAVVNVNSDRPIGWLLHVRRSCRDSSKEIMCKMYNDMRKLGKTEIMLETFNFKSSYERWIKKIGAVKYSIVYKINL